MIDYEKYTFSLTPEYHTFTDIDDQDWITWCHNVKNNTCFMNHTQMMANLFKNATCMNYALVDCNGEIYNQGKIYLK